MHVDKKFQVTEQGGSPDLLFLSVSNLRRQSSKSLGGYGKWSPCQKITTVNDHQNGIRSCFLEGETWNQKTWEVSIVGNGWSTLTTLRGFYISYTIRKCLIYCRKNMIINNSRNKDTNFTFLTIFYILWCHSKTPVGLLTSDSWPPPSHKDLFCQPGPNRPHHLRLSSSLSFPVNSLPVFGPFPVLFFYTIYLSHRNRTLVRLLPGPLVLLYFNLLNPIRSGLYQNLPSVS